MVYANNRAEKNLSREFPIQVFNLQRSCLARARSRSSRHSCYARNTNWSTVLTPIIEKINTANGYMLGCSLDFTVASAPSALVASFVFFASIMFGLNWLITFIDYSALE